MISLNILRATEKTSTGRIQMKEDDKTILYINQFLVLKLSQCWSSVSILKIQMDYIKLNETIFTITLGLCI